MMREEFYFTFNNKTSEYYFSDNSANNFRICLEQKLNFYDQYECALVDFSCTTEYFDTTTKEISIHSNLCEQQLVGDTQDYLIRCTVVNRGRYQMEKFNHPYYMDVRPIKTNCLYVHIKDENGKSASFLNNVTTCTFHFRKQSRFKGLHSFYRWNRLKS